MPHPYFILFVALWAFTASPILIRYSSLPAAWIVTLRLFFALLLLIPLWFIDQKVRGKPAKRLLTPRLFLSGLAMGSHFTLWTLSLNYTSVSSASIAVCCSPVFVCILARLFLHRSLRRTTLFSLGISVMGALFLFINDFRVERHGSTGILLALLGAFLYAIYILIGERERQDRSLFSYVVPVYTIAMLTSLLFALLQKEPLALHMNAREIAIILGLALFPTILGHTAFNYLLKNISATTLSIVGLLEPFLATFVAWILFQERPGSLGVMGGFITMVGIFLCLKSQSSIILEPE